jgi:phage terminase small subunit
MRKKVNEHGLNDKEQLFVNAYLADKNLMGKDAAIKAGYSAHSAVVTASQLLSRPKLRAYIDNYFKKIEDSKIADAAEVERYLTSAIRSELTEQVIVFDKTGLAITKTKDLAGREKIKAAELLARRYGLLTDKIDMVVQGTIIIDASDDMQE